MKRYPAEAVCQWWSGCDRRPSARGLCQKHYKTAARANKNPRIAEPMPARFYEDNQARKCGYCGNPAAVKGLCRAHYSRLYRRGMLKVELPQVSI